MGSINASLSFSYFISITGLFLYFGYLPYSNAVQAGAISEPKVQTNVKSSADSTVGFTGGALPSIDWFGYYEYPQVFDFLNENLDLIGKTDPETLKAALVPPLQNEDTPPNVRNVRRSVSGARHAFYCLTYYFDNLGDYGLDEAGEFKFAWVNHASVKRLMDRARKIFSAKGIPLPGQKEFHDPELPPLSRKR